MNAADLEFNLLYNSINIKYSEYNPRAPTLGMH